jgi:hypothetical protein
VVSRKIGVPFEVPPAVGGSEVGVHLYRINVEFPAAVWSVVVTLSDPPRVGDSIDVKGTACIIREIETRGVDGDAGSVAANVYAEPVTHDVATA